MVKVDIISGFLGAGKTTLIKHLLAHVYAGENVVLIENSSRFHLLPLLNVMKQFGIRSMSFREISYPYWENVARGYEDIFAVFLGMKLLFLIEIVAFLLAVLVTCWKRKTWTLRTGIHWVQDVLYETSAKRAQKKTGKKSG